MTVPIWVLDFETFFSADYTLKKLTTEEYIRDPRFESLLLGVRDPGGNLAWYGQEQIPAFLTSVDWSGAAVLAHHAHFDGLILSHHYGVRPRLWLDTLAMARHNIGNHLSVALGSLARHYGLQDKSVPYDLFKGKRWAELDDPTRRLLGEGCLHDVDLTWEIFQTLAREFPAEEYAVVDMTIRMFTEPVLEGDTALLGQVWMDEERRKAGLLAELGVTADELQSSERFAELLRAEGVEPATKDGKNGPIYAFAKTDDFMKDLQDDDDAPVASLLARARLGVRSTIDQTRAERLGYMSTRGAMAVYLRYCGAHTTRWSGGDALNWQNFRRGGALRKAIQAPAGYLLAVVDLSQIECRVLNLLAGQTDVIEKFARGEDPYVGIASQAYGREITKADKVERGTGKQLELSCGYGAGDLTIQKTAKLGIYGPPVLIDLETAARWKQIYRASHRGVCTYWNEAGSMLNRLYGQLDCSWGPMEVRNRRIYGPNGTWLDYSTLDYDTEAGEWRVKTRQGWAKMYGAKLVENVVQYLSRLILSQAMLRIRQESGLRPATTTHDELVYVIRADQHAEATYRWIEGQMKRTPAWLPGLPLDAEGGLSERYEK